MDFFQSQDNARKQTFRLVILFILAVLSLIVLTNLLIMFLFGFMETQIPGQTELPTQFNWPIFFMAGAGIGLVVLAGSIYKIITLNGGGSRIAEMLGGQLLYNDGNDVHKQRLLNVVEEMAIASGTPVPPVYLLEEEGINAFAAGFSPSDAVIGVTRGCIESLNREQLQGVIAHEFSHILNGDMRLNIRLMGILHGILIIGIIGYYILRSAAWSGGGRRSRNNSPAVMLGLGFGLVTIGYAGTFFGNLIKAAVSRQREFLADASAVQFTRNPDGIGGALKRIGGNMHGSLLDNPGTSEVSHLLFAQGFTTWFSSLFATHPPLEKRIKKIDPRWNGEFDSGQQTVTEETDQTTTETHTASQATAALTTTAVMADIILSANQVGQITPQALAYAHDLLQTIPEPLLTNVHEPYGARAIVYLLLLDEDKTIRNQQLTHLHEHADDGVYETVIKLISDVEVIEVEYRLPLIDLSLSALQQLSVTQYELFKNNIKTLIETDGRVSLFEWSLQKILTHHLDRTFNKANNRQNKYSSLHQLTNAINILLSTLIYAGRQDGISDAEVFLIAKEQLGIPTLELLTRDKLSLSSLNKSLDQLDKLKPLLKPQLLKACATCICADNKATALESELYRAIGNTLDCPIPPLIQRNKN
ncbi:MAG: M48 family metallopeptidase [Gammaproteobacteria bacterium]|nr:M48 family metallopeptidase [Gammaproteobacteria bacterium]